MFAYPKQAEVNSVVPKSKIYAHARPGKRVKELFVSQVGEIRWKYKLAPETINLPARDGIQEIQIFEVSVKTPELNEAVLQCINKAIPFPLLFQLTYPEHTSFAACYKRPSETAGSKWVTEGFFTTSPLQLSSFVFQPLPVALDLASLYEQLVRSHISLPARAGEGIREHVHRFNTIAAKENERQQLKARLNQEKQFNRKVDVNAALRSITQELQNLKRL